jgi:hypothetical protein
MRKPPTAIEIITVVVTLLVVLWFVGRNSKPVQIERAEPPGREDLPRGGSGAVDDSDATAQGKAGDVPSTPEGKSTDEKAAGKRVFPIETTLKVPSFLEQILSGADSEEAWLLDRGMGFLKDGNYEEARRLFRALMDEHPDSTLTAPAQWASAHSYYLEGGPDNIALSAGRFADFLVRFSKYKPEILVEAAQIDLAIICMDIMRSDAKEQVRMEAATAAASALQSFLERWPDNPQAAAARASLLQIQSYLSRQQKSGAANRH